MASKRAPPPKPERPRHTVQQKLADIAALERRIKEPQYFDPATVRKRFTDPKVQVLQTAIDETLSDIFGNGSDDYERYSSAASLDQGGLSMVIDGYDYHDDAAEARQYVAEGKERSLEYLGQAVKRLKEEIEDAQRSGVTVTQSGPAHAARAVAPTASRKIFIVHGHDDAMRSEVARVVHQLGFEPVILHEQPNMGRTLIEKFEDHSETAGFAIVLLSPDDEGRVRGADAWAARAPERRVRTRVLRRQGWTESSLRIDAWRSGGPVRHRRRCLRAVRRGRRLEDGAREGITGGRLRR